MEVDYRGFDGSTHVMTEESSNHAGTVGVVDRARQSLSRQVSVAPMMDWTDRHCRYFLRGFSPRVLLYTEMITAEALLRGDAARLLRYAPEEQPLALQLGGSAAGGAGRLLRNQPELRLPQRSGARGRFWCLPDGTARARGGVRSGDARGRDGSSHREDAHRHHR